MHTTWFRASAIASASFAAVIAAGPRASAQQAPHLPPIRHLGARLAVSTDTLASLAGLRALSDGRVLINDVAARRLVLFDSALRRPQIVADSTPRTNKAYGTPVGGMIAYAGDSTFFVDPTSVSFVVLDPGGKAVRVMAPPRPKEVGTMLNLGGSSVAFDGRGSLVYRTAGGKAIVSGAAAGATRAATAAVPRVGIPSHDSVAIARIGLVTHATDTVGFLATMLTQPPRMDQDAEGNLLMSMTVYPVSATDEWAMVSDGSIAFVRASDYHVDWINADGTRSSSPKIAHEWTRMSDAVKQHLVDSTRHVIDSLHETVQKQAAVVLARSGLPPTTQLKVAISAPDISEIPDYPPPFSSGAVKADCENNLWIRTGPSRQAASVPAVYDVVNRKGQLVDRVELPPSMALAGFGPGVAYLTSREGTGLVLVKYHIR